MWPMILGCMLPLLVIAWTDYRRHWVPNAITVPMFLAAIAYAVYQGNITDALAGAGVAFLAGLICFIIGGMGGGDVKLLAALGAWFGLGGIYPVVLIACSIGVVWGLAKIVRTGQLRQRMGIFFRGLYLRLVYNAQGSISFPKLPEDIKAPIPKDAIPFGTCLAVAAWMVWAVNVL